MEAEHKSQLGFIKDLLAKRKTEDEASKSVVAFRIRMTLPSHVFAVREIRRKGAKHFCYCYDSIRNES
jgi:hypothetical protein